MFYRKQPEAITFLFFCTIFLSSFTGKVWSDPPVTVSKQPPKGKPVNWMRFQEGSNDFQGTPYWWLGKFQLTFHINAKPDANHALDLLWGSENDTRSAVITINDVTLRVEKGGYRGFRWLRIPIPEKVTEDHEYHITMRQNGTNQAFIAAIRLTDTEKDVDSPQRMDPPVQGIQMSTREAKTAKPEGQYASAHPAILKMWEDRRVSNRPSFQQAATSARIAGHSLSLVHRWLHEKALPQIDKETGLYRVRGKWDYRDTAADCYPFLTWAAWVTQPDLLEGPVLRILRREQELCNTKGNLPAPYNFEKGKPASISKSDQIFGATEYVKDGLVPIIEVTGKGPWYGRAKELVEAIWQRAGVKTDYGKIPSQDVEVHGEMLQVLPRLYRMSGEEKFLRWAERLAGYYLLRDDLFLPNKLDDHGNEVIGGLGLLLAVESRVNPEKANEYRPPFKRILQEIIDRGTNDDGMFYNSLGGSGNLSDNWGYNYVAHLCYDMSFSSVPFVRQVRRTLGNLGKKTYRDYPWEGGDHPDGFGDSIEGGLYVLNRHPVPEALEWTDRETMKHLIPPAPSTIGDDELWGTMKLHANGVRTVIMHAMMHTRGCRALPWQDGMKLGASQQGDELALVLESEREWSGKLVFDFPRHNEFVGFDRDWPRINALPEWFTVKSDREYTVLNVSTGERNKMAGSALREGKPVELESGERLRLRVSPADQ